MGKTCCVKGCTVDADSRIFYISSCDKFNRAPKWVRALGLPESPSKIPKELKVCSKHFCVNCFEFGLKFSSERFLHLKHEAVPHVDVPNESPCPIKLEGKEEIMSQENEEKGPDTVIVYSNSIAHLLGAERNQEDDSIYLVQKCEELKPFMNFTIGRPVEKKKLKLQPAPHSEVLRDIRVVIPGNSDSFDLCRICCDPLIDKVGDPSSDLKRYDVKTVQNMLKLVLPNSEWQMYRNSVICDKCLKLIEQTFKLIQNFIKTTENLKNLFEKTKSVVPPEQKLIVIKKTSSGHKQGIDKNNRDGPSSKQAHNFQVTTNQVVLNRSSAANITNPNQIVQNVLQQSAALITKQNQIVSPKRTTNSTKFNQKRNANVTKSPIPTSVIMTEIPQTLSQNKAEVKSNLLMKDESHKLATNSIKSKSQGNKSNSGVSRTAVSVHKDKLMNTLIKRTASPVPEDDVKRVKVEPDCNKTFCCCVCYETFPDTFTLMTHLNDKACSGPRDKSDLVITGL